MIQRIQSLYLLLISLLSALFLAGRFSTFHKSTGSEIVMNISGIWDKGSEGNLTNIGNLVPLSGILILTALISFVAIFLYKHRKLQMKVTITIIILSVITVALIVFYALSVILKYKAEINPGAEMILPLLVIISGILAYRGIKRDEKLVKSYDRLR
jgi:ABC-type spermidine/putrescine transport system permease subunit I